MLREQKNVIEKIKKSEGYYSNNPHDLGKETYRGISRRYHPAWKGWKLIDKIKEKGIVHNQRIEELEPLVNEFYFKYLDRFRVWEFPPEFQHLLSDTIILHGGTGVKMLQKSLGCKTDGSLGVKTISAFKRFISKYDINILKDNIITLRKDYYIKKNNQFTKGWLNRLKQFKTKIPIKTGVITLVGGYLVYKLFKGGQ